MLHCIDGRQGGNKAFGKGGAQKLSLLLGGGANTTITIAIGNSTSNNNWDRHLTTRGWNTLRRMVKYDCCGAGGKD